MPAATSCTTCGTPLSESVLAGLCPTCVRRFAMAEDATPGDTAAGARSVKTPPGGWEPPSVRDVAAVLPAGAYRVESLIGRGGMGAVYKGWQTSLERYVAIKILPRGLEDDGICYAERFKAEAKAMARLTHPGIVTVFDAGQADGLLYFVMEFIEGTDVQALMAQGPLPPERALAITSDVCDALAFAHDSGIVHRDIKPSNIMLDRSGRVKVSDFGLAKVVAQESAGFTRTNLVMGSPDFMAPETMTGAANVDHRADLYAVGVMLYAMLTRQTPRGKYVLPSRLVPQLDKRLDRIVDRALQPDRDARYSSAIELKTAIEPVLARILARRTGSVRGAGKTKRISLLSAVAIVLAAGGWFVWQERSAESRAAATSRNTANSSDSPAGGAAVPAEASKETPFVNSLGMRFVPVPITGGPTDGQRVLFSIWETRVQDYDVFASETKSNWPDPRFAQGRTRPAVNMTWDDAQAFCTWLTERERKTGSLTAAQRYRLPTDHEWSCAVGIGDREDATQIPADKILTLPDSFPWENAWPPAGKAGNYAGEELLTPTLEERMLNVKGVIAGYRDGFNVTAPVGSFPPNRFGLYDMGGNVWEWCEDWYEKAQSRRVMRGASWVNDARANLLSSFRDSRPPETRKTSIGFRIVLVGREDARRVSKLPAVTKDAPFTNSLGMQFVPVPITGGPTDGQRVLFSIWETRVQDYEVFVKEMKLDWSMRPDLAPDRRYPAASMSWDEAQAFCAWLTGRELKAGTLGADQRYRLPTDHEWSCAIGIGARENPGLLPSEKSGKLASVFPWGSQWPPPEGAGNFSGEETIGHEVAPGEQKSLMGYRDAFIHAAPVGSFPPNALGLHDLSGNVWEWCEDWFDATQQSRVMRGCTWENSDRLTALSSHRSRGNTHGKSARGYSIGFRCVLAE